MSPTGFESADVAIVGGGIVGCSTALWLAEMGIKVALFERGRIASEQSGRAWGFIRQQGRHAAEFPLAMDANRLWPELTERLGAKTTQFTRDGILMLAETADDEGALDEAHATAARFQVRASILQPVEIKALIPELYGHWRRGLLTPDDGHGEPGTSTEAIGRAAEALGARLYENQPVVDVETTAGKPMGVRTASGLCKAGAVLLAGGVGTPALARRLGLNLPIQAIRGSVGETMATAPFTRLAVRGPHVSFRARPDGSFYLGSGYRGVGSDYDITVNSLRNLRYFLPAYAKNRQLLSVGLGREFWNQARAALGARQAADPLPEPAPNHAKIERNLARFHALFPHLGELALARRWAGRIDISPDLIPIIDQPLAGLFIACGFSGHGFGLGPAVGRQMANWIGHGRPTLNLDPFRLDRFRRGAADLGRRHTG